MYGIIHRDCSEVPVKPYHIIITHEGYIEER